MVTKNPGKKPTKRRAPEKSDRGKKAALRPARKRVRHQVEVDEARERLGVESPEALSLQTANGIDALGEELGEAYVENVTGADDAAMEHRAYATLEDEGGPFVITTGATEFAQGSDASNPADAEREALPTVSAPQLRPADTKES